MKKYIISFLLLFSFFLNAQETPRPEFSSPFDFPLLLSGNFGELRANHFHAGIDVKTQGVSGKRLLALADGYISRIRITHGSGYVLHVTYDNGFITVSRHLSGFVGKVAQRAKEEQYVKESWEIDIIPDPEEFPVKRGEQIAWSGNTGYSFGPHLHLEVIEEATGDYIDPLLFYKKKIKDTKPPKAQGIMIFPQKGKGVVNGSPDPQPFSLKAPAITAWGEIGVAIRALDYMDDTTNNFGVHTVSLKVDGVEVFKSVVNRFSAYEDRMINSWTYKRYMKSFIEPGNALRMLEAKNDNRGLITIDEERDYLLTYRLTDLYGNSQSYSFTIAGKKQDIPPLSIRDKYHLKWDKINFLQEPGLELFLPKKVLYDDLYLDVKLSYDSCYVSYLYEITPEITPLHTFATLKLGIKRKEVDDDDKYYIVGFNAKGKAHPIGGTYINGFLEARIRELGTFAIAVDTVPPTIIPLHKTTGRRDYLQFKVKDEESGIKSYRGTIDGQFVPFGLHIMSDQLRYKLDPKVIKKGKEHTVELIVIDKCNNHTVWEETFFW
ncbi:MAG: M23 family metallopeptidase [Bacteroidales bacterium]|nr:M23 family metallopeptidase [Bacteroidales bacterium]